MTAKVSVCVSMSNMRLSRDGLMSSSSLPNAWNFTVVFFTFTVTVGQIGVTLRLLPHTCKHKPKIMR